MVAALMELADVPGSPVAYLSDPSYEMAIAAWARVEAGLERLEAWFVDREYLDGDDEPRAATRLLDRFRTRAESLRARLGLDPLSRARLGRDIAAGQVDVARLLSMDELEDDS
jgi:hypothetical protein